jgi:selenocysteine lyase/cysteine desulfurase
MKMLNQAESLAPMGNAPTERSMALTELAQRVYAALETYSNVHRGAGPNSEATTALFERARAIVLEHFGLDGATHAVVFSDPLGANSLGAQLNPEHYRVLSSQELGLPLGVRAIAVERSALLRRWPLRAGGGTVKIVSPDSVIWSDVPNRFEAGTPAIMNVIATACALQLTRRFGPHSFQCTDAEASSIEAMLYHDDYSKHSGPQLFSALKEAVVGFGVGVPTRRGKRPYIHLDHAASTQALLPVWACVCQVWRQPQRARPQIVHEVKGICAEFLGAPPNEYSVIFTANTTEAIIVAAASLPCSVPAGIQPVVLNTWLEHNSNELPWRDVPGSSMLRLSVDDEGFVDLDELVGLLQQYNSQQRHGCQRIALLALSGASNVLGSYNNLPAICRIAHQYGARVLVDAAQLAAHRRIEMARWGVDYLALSGHKLYAPFGSGVLLVRNEIVAQQPLVWERIKACGEENVTGIAAIGKAMVLLQRIGMSTVEAEERQLTLQALQGLSTIQGVEIWGVKGPESPRIRHRGGIIAFSIRHVPHNRVAQELAERAGIGARTGCHCAHLLVKRLLRIRPWRAKTADLSLLLFPRFASIVLPGLVRVSLGIGNDQHDVSLFLRTVQEIVDAPRSHLDRFWARTHNGTPWVGRSQVRAQMLSRIAVLLAEVYDDCASSDGAKESTNTVARLVFPAGAPVQARGG